MLMLTHFISMQYQTKIKHLFEKFLEPDFEIQNEVYLNKLLTHLSREEKAEVENAIFTLPIFTEWILQAVLTWESHRLTPATNIASFTLNLTSLLSKNERIYCELCRHNFYVKLINILQVREPEAAPVIKLGYIKLLTSFLNHRSGFNFVSQSYLWEDMLFFSLSNQTLYIKRESHKFMFNVLDRGLQCDQELCVNVISRIMEPLSETNYRALKPCNNNNHNNDMMEVIDELVHQNLSSTLELVGNILEEFLESRSFQSNNFKLVEVFVNSFCLEQRVCNFMIIAQNKTLVFDLGKIMYLLQFFELYIHIDSTADIVNSIRKIIIIFKTNISRGNFENVMKFCYFGQFYWNLMGSKIPNFKYTKDNEPITFANQLLLLQLVPIFAIAMKYCGSDKEVSGDEFRDNYVQNLFDMMCEHTIRIAYMWRAFLIAQPNLFEIATKALTYIMKSRKYYPKFRANWAFQAFLYALKDYMRVINESPDMAPFFAKEVNFLSLLFDAFVTFIEEFEITWRDCVETIYIVKITLDFLMVPTWPTKLVIKALKLVNVAFAKYMPPNLALLVDSDNDSTTVNIGPVLVEKLRDSNWEVRKSALDVVQTISHFANKQFPSLQKVLMDSDLPGLVVKMAIGDGESFVRATAIKCLQEMIQVEEIWNNSLKSQDLSGKMRQILINETEGIVRVEAATFMCISYENNQFPEETLERVYETMIHSSTTDLHWEVKVRALNFWDKVINNHLQHQGMIDGSFPSVTFSKEHRKIVTLTDAEIKKRLLKVLGQLSSIGCLGVLISAIRDDCDMEVSKTAVKITQKLVELLKKYNIHGDCSVPTSPQPTENGMSSSASISSGVSGDDCMSSPVTPANSDLNEEIINQIVNSRDVNLLQNVYTPSDYGSVLNYDLQVRTIVSPNEFLLFTQQDLNVIINEKKNWLNGIEDLGSLLDDMLKSYDDDVNSMDCY